MDNRPEIRSLTVVAPMTTQSLPEAWREGAAGASSDAVVFCTAPIALGDTDRRALLDASAHADAVLGVSPAGGAGLLVRGPDVARLVLLRNRSGGLMAVRNAVSRLRQSGRTVNCVSLTESLETGTAAADDGIRTAGRWLAEQLSRVGFAAGICSRSHCNLEVWKSRRVSSDVAASSRCPLCGAGTEAQVGLGLRTSADLRDLGEYHAVLCTQCDVARTEPAPHDTARVISPDLGDNALSVPQQTLMRRFIGQRVTRVRPLLPAGRRPRIVDVGGGAGAFANALGATDCDVTVFEPNPANARFVDASSGVRFVPAPFDERAVAAAGIADGSLDGITMWHSLEHVPDPAATLALARRLLRRGGVLYACVPNLDSMQSDVGGTHWCYADIPHHVTHFSLEGLAAAMRQAGFGTLTPHWWNAEYEIFGWYQTLLNLLTGSHNYFYNRAKKGRLADAGPRPTWTRVATALGPILLPAAATLSWCASAASKPACVEMHGIAS